MRTLLHLVAFCVAASPVLSASSVLSCAFNAVDPLTASPNCYTAPFNVVETVDLQTAFGTANGPASSVPLTYTTPGQGVTISVGLPYDYSGSTGTIGRFDNFGSYYDSRLKAWRAYNA